MKNSNFHILSVMVGTRNTPDEAYRVLYFELEAQEHAYATALAERKRGAAKRARIEELRRTGDALTKLEAEADLLQLIGDERRHEAAIARAESEMTFIRDLMDALEPHRRYRDLPLLEAFQACQAEEWALEYVKRAKRFLLTMGTIPHDHFEVMQSHPWFDDFILPHVNRLSRLYAAGQLSLATFADETPPFLAMLRERHPELVQSAAMAALPVPPSLQLAAPAEE